MPTPVSRQATPMPHLFCTDFSAPVPDVSPHLRRLSIRQSDLGVNLAIVGHLLLEEALLVSECRPDVPELCLVGRELL